MVPQLSSITQLSKFLSKRALQNGDSSAISRPSSVGSLEAPEASKSTRNTAMMAEAV